MSRTHYGAYVLLWMFSLVECKVPEVRVTCVFSEECVLPCSFTHTEGELIVQWFQQDSLILSLPQTGQTLRNGRLSFVSDDILKGNASVRLNNVDTRSKGRYRCVVNSVTQTYVAATVEAPIRSISLVRSESSGVMNCSTSEVYPAPVLQWSSEPRVPAGILQPVTRITPAGKGLFSAESILKQANYSSDQVFVCNITSKYGTQTWTASLKLQELNIPPGRSLVIPCRAPKSLLSESFSLLWTFSSGNQTSDVLLYNSRTHTFIKVWDQAELEGDEALKGDLSLTIKKPVASDHVGVFTCAVSGGRTQHLIQTRVKVPQKKDGKGSLKYNLWMFGIVGGLIALLVAVVVVKRYRAKAKRNHDNSQEDAEMQGINSAKTAEEVEAGNKLLAEASTGHSDAAEKKDESRETS